MTLINGKQKPIIFLHPELLSNWIWKGQKINLKEYQVITPDIIEHGDNLHNEEFTIKKASEKIIELIKNETPKGKAILIGIGLGGQIILQILGMNPKLIDKAIISGVNIKLPTREDTGIWDETHENYFKLNTKFRIYAILAQYNLKPLKYYDKIEKSDSSINPQSLYEVINEVRNFELPSIEDNDKLTIFVGEKEERSISQSAILIRNQIPSAKIYFIHGTGTLWNILDKKLFNKNIKNIIRNKPIVDKRIKLLKKK